MTLRATATNFLAAVAVLGFLLTEYVWGISETYMAAGFIPARWSGIALDSVIPAVLTPLTAAFLHVDVTHIGFNLLVLLYCGNLLESRLGSVRMTMLFVAGAYLAAVAQWWVDPAAALPMIGASGAVSAILGAFALSFGSRRQLVASSGLNRFLNATWLFLFWIAFQYALDLYGRVEGTLIATPAHVGGFLAGLLLHRWLSPVRRSLLPPSPPTA
ncbi:rhomboid family intramembrane serine protease [Sphingomicrobium arenosum]|uniref:rhomboid family intramembrane serine protease n=1 Tax=Sphingomicrobium arenosum TaxID=2233861 RepID=UPI00223EC2A6|nr:rhomboid family intramembrane serine protease [Sphingomicrobium arenosum]